MTIPTIKPRQQAIAIVIKNKGYEDRYWYGFGKKNILKTAWSLAGATLFHPKCSKLDKVVRTLDKKKQKFEYTVVSV